jgi:hypothetical protein
VAVDLDNTKHRGVRLYADLSDLVVENPIEVVAGGAGFVSDSGAVSLDLTSARAFHTLMTGNITSLSFTNVPSGDTYATSWSWVLRIDGTGGYTLENTPTVTFADGSSWSDVSLTANAENVLLFWRVGTTTYGAILMAGDIALDPYKVCFLEDAEVVIMAEAEDIDVANDSQGGDGVITYKKGSGASLTDITARTTFALGDRLHVICTGQTGVTTVRIPRFV